MSTNFYWKIDQPKSPVGAEIYYDNDQPATHIAKRGNGGIWSWAQDPFKLCAALGGFRYYNPRVEYVEDEYGKGYTVDLFLEELADAMGHNFEMIGKNFS